MEIIASCPPRLPLSEVGRYAQRIESLGYDVLHVPETIHDAFTVAALAITHTSRLVIRTSMVVAFPRSPMLTAYAAWDLAKLSAGRFQLGIASQVRGNIVGRFSTPWSDPVARLGDYVASLRAIFHSFQTGEPLEHTGSHYRFERLQPYFNPGPIDHPAPQIWTGGVNAEMCALAGRVSDGFVCHPTSSHPRMLERRILPALARGAREAGRDDNGPAVVVGPYPLIAKDSRELARVRRERRAELAFLYSTPAYRRQLEEFGLGDLGAALSDMARRKDWANLADLMSDDVIAMLVPQGTFEEMPGILSDWYAGRCSGIVINVPDDSEHDDLYRLLVDQCRGIPAAPA
ncbi:TIGR03617 family F420-dependent LLM class oxidoreductase [Thermomonospora sp. CIF 1]|uniref:TIGR03617 family F420-dependent LLM class oxidoreductase n=1 Tax=Thermomonospora sp. CIF 1 TaxID=1916083 RepID=UPI000B0885E5|nr:TIGR03617 family F420-dependent LLM class oxidoreductase [Thermomonospora sp. CIF 1]PKK12701.1 MAG: LLM class F420-dependent oxidoreductase [Thermomonospora sp. CIF 1]